jgi:hypothetical protein
MLALAVAAVATSFGGDALPFVPVRGVERASAHFWRKARTWTRLIMIVTCPGSFSFYKIYPLCSASAHPAAFQMANGGSVPGGKSLGA